MTEQEFGNVLAMMIRATGATFTLDRDGKPTEEKQTSQVYFGFLRDLEADVVMAGATMAVANHNYRNLPPVGIIRKAALALMAPTMPADEAWAKILAAVDRFGVGKCGPKHERDAMQVGLDHLSPSLHRIARMYWIKIRFATEQTLGIVQHQFGKDYGNLRGEERQRALMPPAVRAIAEKLGGQLALDEGNRNG